ncbi:MAG TPA: hypothetical protein PLN92_04835 [Thermotogota bacterium]|nr:hypothetical protein [Thermotogota bacterium]
MKKTVKSYKISFFLKFLILIILFSGLFACTAMAYRFDIGVGVEKIDHAFPFVHCCVNTKYILLENDFAYLHEFGMIDTIGFFLKLDSVLTPKFGISACWGYNQIEGFFFEKNGIIVTAGLAYCLDRYSVSFSAGQFVAFDGRISEKPTIKFSCSIKIGEW